MKLFHGMLLSAVRWYALSVFIILWLTIGWQDWRLQRIKHQYLFYGIIAMCLGYGFIIFNRDYWAYYNAAAVHILFCVIAAMVLWFMRIWPAGDAKLFIFLAFLYPLMNMPRSLPQERMFLIILINTFIPAAVFLFFRAGFYMFDTRLRSSRNFLIQLGWKREFDYFLGIFRQSALDVVSDIKTKGAELRMLGLVGLSVAAFEGFKRLLPFLLQWVTGMILMSFISYYLRNLFNSPIFLCLLCMGMFYLWNRISSAIGAVLARFFLGTLVISLLMWFPPADWVPLKIIFGNITVFSFFMFIGVNWTLRILAGEGSALIIMALPLVFSALGYLISRIGTSVAGMGNQAIFLFNANGSALSARLFGGFSALSPYMMTMMSLALLGLFFGLVLVLVRKWDDEVRPSHTRDALSAFLVLDPAFLKRVRQDEEFYNAHFQSNYADGLTVDQAQALKEWCVKNNIDVVPLAPTISFASWIFLGFFLSLILRNSHVLQAL